MDVFFDDTVSSLDCLFDLEQLVYRSDFMYDRILNYLFFYKFSEDSLINVCVGLFLSMEREMTKTHTSQSILNLFARPKYYLDMSIFDKYIF